jgi:hypothetical protein
MDAEDARGLGNIAAAVGEHPLDVFPLHAGERRRLRLLGFTILKGY